MVPVGNPNYCLNSDFVVPDTNISSATIFRAEKSKHKVIFRRKQHTAVTERFIRGDDAGGSATSEEKKYQKETRGIFLAKHAW